MIFALKHYDDAEHINIGSGKDLTILELAQTICKVVGFDGGVVTSPDKPDGTPRKLMGADKLRALGWTPSIDLEAGIKSTYQWYLDSKIT